MEGHLDTFKQVLNGPVWDGNLASKAQRDLLKEAGFIDRAYGFNYITAKGVEAAVALGFIQRGDTVAAIKRAILDDKPKHYDSNGYCDNPARGY